MSRINANVPALKAIFQLQRNNADLAQSLQRLSTGLRINRGADDPAGLILSERLRSEARGLKTAISNSIRANSVVATAEGALNEVSSLLLSIQSLVVRSSNEAGLTDEELQANQLEIDSILASIDRIADTTRFGNEKLLNGQKGYLLSTYSSNAFGSLSVFGAHVKFAGTRTVKVQVTQSALAGEVVYLGSTVGGVSRTSATTIEIRGTIGSEVISFVSGTTLAQIRDSINSVRLITGVSAVVSSPGGAVASALRLNSLDLGADAFVSVTPIGGNFIEQGTRNIERREIGREAIVLIDNQSASVDGLRAEARSSDFDARVVLTRQFAQTLSSATFTLLSTGAVFQITGEIKPSGQGHIGFGSVATTHLGDEVIGLLHSLRSGQGNQLAGKNFTTAQQIVDEAIQQVGAYRARLGSFQRNLLEPTINAESIAFENVTASESVIRDADIAVEVSNLTRAQVLVQSTQSTLRIANAVPNQVLALLQ